MNDVTVILKQIDQGEASLEADLIPLIYQELRRIAQSRISRESPDHTLQATALVNEYYLKISSLDEANALSWENRKHFFQAAAKAMQNILVDHARRKKRLKRGGDRVKAELPENHEFAEEQAVDQVELYDALNKLEAENPRAAQTVRLKYFTNLTNSQVAMQLGVSTATTERDWSYAKSWLQAEMQKD